MLGDQSRSQIQRLIKDGHILIAGRTVKPNQPVKTGDSIAVDIPDPVDPMPQPESLPLPILYQDPDVIVWLDCVTWHTAIWRISVRTARWGLEEAKRQPGVRKFTRFRDFSRNLRLFIGVLTSSRRYYHTKVLDGPVTDPIESRMATAQYLAPYWAKVVHCRTDPELQVFMAGIIVESQGGYTPQEI